MNVQRNMLVVFVLALLVSLCCSEIALAHCGICGRRRRPKHVEVVQKVEAVEVSKINTKALWAMVSARVAVAIVDARTGKWDDGVRIPGARALSPKANIDEIKRMLPDRKALIITYCASLKCPASSMLFKRLKSMGYVNLIEYPQGIKGWKEAGYPVKHTR